MASSVAPSEGPRVPARTSRTTAARRLAAALAPSELDEPAAASAADSEVVSGVGSPFVGSDSTCAFVGSTLMPHHLPRNAALPARALAGHRGATCPAAAAPADRAFRS